MSCPACTTTSSTTTTVPPASNCCLRVRYVCRGSTWVLDVVTTACVDNATCSPFSQTCTALEYTFEQQNACVCADPLPTLPTPTCTPSCGTTTTTTSTTTTTTSTTSSTTTTAAPLIAQPAFNSTGATGFVGATQANGTFGPSPAVANPCAAGSWTFLTGGAAFAVVVTKNGNGTWTIVGSDTASHFSHYQQTFAAGAITCNVSGHLDSGGVTLVLPNTAGGADPAYTGSMNFVLGP